MSSTRISLSDLTNRADIMARVRECDEAILAFAAHVAPGYELGEIEHPYFDAFDGLVLQSPDRAEVHVLVDSLSKDQWIVIERFSDDEDESDLGHAEVSFRAALYLWTSNDGEDEENASGASGESFESIAALLAAAQR